MKNALTITIVALTAVALLGLSGCGDSTPREPEHTTVAAELDSSPFDAAVTKDAKAYNFTYSDKSKAAFDLRLVAVDPKQSYNAKDPKKTEIDVKIAFVSASISAPKATAYQTDPTEKTKIVSASYTAKRMATIHTSEKTFKLIVDTSIAKGGGQIKKHKPGDISVHIPSPRELLENDITNSHQKEAKALIKAAGAIDTLSFTSTNKQDEVTIKATLN